MQTKNLLDALEQRLIDCAAVTVAVSGGVDSLTLAAVAHRLGGEVSMVHARSPAVPDEATARVRDMAVREGWRLDVVDAGEFADPAYRANPVNRCFFCKSHLYDAIGALTTRQIVSGANLDDLAEYRPGLDAARKRQVRHPYIEAGIDKAAVRQISAMLGLGEIADLPASPCLSSRVETGIAIEPATLRMVHAVERLVAAELAPRTVRCRVRASGVVIELDPATFAALDAVTEQMLTERIGQLQPASSTERTIRFAPYRTGSAFLIAAA